MTTVTEMLVAVRPPAMGEVQLSQLEIEIGVRDGVIPVLSMATKVRQFTPSRTFSIKPEIA